MAQAISKKTTNRAAVKSDVLTSYGGGLKVLSVKDDKATVGGYGIVFGGKDLSGEWFTKSTWLGSRGPDGSDSLFHHGFPIVDGLDDLSDHLFQPWKATVDEIGVFFETCLDMANEYEKAVYNLTVKGVLGLSSGAPAHMVKIADTGEILRWPVSECSFTPTPCEPRTKVLPIKSCRPAADSRTAICEAFQVAEPLKSFYDYFDDVEEGMTVAAYYELRDSLTMCLYNMLFDNEQATLSEQLDYWAQQVDTFKEKSLAMLSLFLAQDATEDAAEQSESVKRFAESLKTRLDAKSHHRYELKAVGNIREFERFLREAGYSRGDAIKIASSGYNAILQRDSGSETATTPTEDAATKARILTLQHEFAARRLSMSA